MRIVSVLESPAHRERAIAYFQSRWGSKDSQALYDDCIRHSAVPLPQWYLLLDDKDEIIGGAGLITNDFISRGDLYPWICTLIIEPEHRGHEYGALLLERAKADAKVFGFPAAYLATDHIGYYEKYGFEHIGTGYHPWGESSRIYRAKLEEAK